MMNPLQQDDVRDYLDSPKRRWKFIHLGSGKVVKAEDKREAIKMFQETHNLSVTRKTIERI